ncbi:MAG: nucleotidyltransferase domain-containing protein [Deltaproteobacteria bacterium]|nr:nucleotidyltransferase domain-containing protein [Deltaproteobacteria bacterium]
MLTDNELKALQSLKGLISEKYKLLEFVVYGSKASGTDTVESDIDLMIELEDEILNARWDIYKITADVNIEYGCVISPVLFSRKEIEDGPLGESPIYKRIAEEGVSV